MSDERIAELSRALRDDAAAPPNDGAFTLARIERSLGTKQKTRAKLTRIVILPIAAVFLVATAWAGASGNLGRWLAPKNPLEGERASKPAREAPSSRPSVIAIAPAIEAAPSATEEPAPAPSASPAIAVTVAPPPDADALYRRAHTLHFVDHDYGAAVTAWDRYLSTAGPSGRFALEARYNRAIALTRLGRKSEAAAALRPFANGDYGGYRREQAQELLRTLE